MTPKPFNELSAIIHFGFALLFVFICLIKIITWGRIGKTWGIWLAIKEPDVKPEYPEGI